MLYFYSGAFDFVVVQYLLFLALDESTMTLGTILDLMLISGPTLLFFVFYTFNNHFNKAFLKIFQMRQNLIYFTNIITLGGQI